MKQQQKLLTAIILLFCGLLFFNNHVLAISGSYITITDIGVPTDELVVDGLVTQTRIYPTLTFYLIADGTEFEYLAPVETVVWSNGSQHNYWTATLDLDNIPAGDYHLQVIAHFASGDTVTYISYLFNGEPHCNGGICVPGP